MNPTSKQMARELIDAYYERLRERQQKRHPVLEDFNFTAEDEKWLNEEMRISL